MLVLMANNIDGWAIAMDVKATCGNGLVLQEMNMKLPFQEKGKAYKKQALLLQLSLLFLKHIPVFTTYPC